MSIRAFLRNSKGSKSQLKRSSLQLEVLEDRTLLSASPSTLTDDSLTLPIDASPQTIAMSFDNSESLTVDMGDSANCNLQAGESQLSPPDGITSTADALSLEANENYNTNDYSKLRSFLEQTDGSGRKNGLKVNAQYNSNNPATWTGVVWSVIDGEKRVTSVNWTGLCLAGNANFSNCAYLTELDITGANSDNYGSLASLNITGCTRLSQLNLYYNQLKSLDLTSNNALNGLDCTGNQLSSIDVSQNTALTYLRVYENQIKSLDVSNNTELVHLITCYNQLTSLDVSHNPKLQLLQCYNNRIVTLDLRNNVNLTELICWNPTLQEVQMSEAAIDTVRIRLCVADNTPWTYKNSAGQVLTTTTSDNPYFTISELPVYATNQAQTQTISFVLGVQLNYAASECAQIKAFLEQNGNGLKVNPSYSPNEPSTWGIKWVDVDGVYHAYEIDWTGKRLSGSANLSNFTYLKGLAITGVDENNPGGLTSLNISGCTALEGCDCYYNQLTSLDLSTNSSLLGLTCNDNQLTSLDVSHNAALQWLDCQTNQISELNVSSNRALTHLHCSWNQLQTLNLAQNTKLTELYCNSNRLTTLDLSHNTALSVLRCWNENLTTVTLPESAAGQLSVNLYWGPWIAWGYTDNNITVEPTINAYTPSSIPFTASSDTQTILFTNQTNSTEVIATQNDFVKTTLNNPVVIDFLKNDTIPDMSETTIHLGNASYGQYYVNDNGAIVYTPEEGFFGTDALSYVLISSDGTVASGAIVINVGLPIAASVQTTADSHSPSTSMAASVKTMTDWDKYCVELWAQGVSELNPGETTLIMEYNPAVYNAPTFESCVDGVALTVSQSSVLPNGNVEVELTANVTKPISSQTDSLFMGTVVLSPSTVEGAGVNGDAVSVCSLDGSELTTTVMAMPYNFDSDNKIDVNDFIKFATVFGCMPDKMDVNDPLYAQARQADYDGNGIVNVNDFIAFATNFGIVKGKKYNIQLPERVDAVPGAPVQSSADELNYEEQSAVQAPVVTPQSAQTVEVVAAVEESQVEFMTPSPAKSAQTESVQTLRQTHSSALLDLYDNQNGSETVVELSAPAVDTALYQDDEFDFLFDSDSDSDGSSDVDLSVVLDELELELK